MALSQCMVEGEEGTLSIYSQRVVHQTEEWKLIYWIPIMADQKDVLHHLQVVEIWHD